MSKDTSRRTSVGTLVPRPGVSALAAQALAQVLLTPKGSQNTPDPDLVALLRSMVLSSPMRQPEKIVAEMRSHGLNDAEIVDAYIPATARVLGDCWLSDDLPFAQVSIGTARLQGLLPLLDDSAPSGLIGPKGVALLLVTAGEDHTLGAFVLAHQLRRCGVSIHVMVGAPQHEITSVVKQGGFDVVMFSCAQPSNLENIAKLVNKLRKSCDTVPPLLLGGAVSATQDEVVEKTGVDLVLTGYSDLLPMIEGLAAKGAGRT